MPKLGTSVDVTFSKPFSQPPVVTINLVVQDANDSAFLAGVTTHGFTIVLDESVPRDLTFNWMALAIDNPQTVVGKSLLAEPVVSAIASAQPQATPSDVPTAASGAATSSESSGRGELPTPTPTLTLTVTPTPLSLDGSGSSSSSAASSAATPY